jgi:hypothetical protein
MIGSARRFFLSVLAQTGLHFVFNVGTTLCASNARKAGHAAHG